MLGPLLGGQVNAISLSSGAAAALPDRYQTGKAQIETTFGVHLVETPHALKDDSWLYQHPEARAEDLHWALTNPEIKGVISTIGGDESVRILPYVDTDLIRNYPKVFMGFSDATISLTAFLNAGVVAFHGPAVMTDLAENGGVHPFVEKSVRSVLFNAEAATLEAAESWTEEFLDWADPALQTQPRTFLPSKGWVWLQGRERVQGRLVGGNIEALEFLKGTRWWPQQELWQGAILYLETSEEAPAVASTGYWLRNYGSQGILKGLPGLLFARPMRYTAEGRWRLYSEIRRVLAEFGRTDLPVVANMDFGHTSPQLVLPNGCLAEIDPLRKRVALLEVAVF